MPRRPSYDQDAIYGCLVLLALALAGLIGMALAIIFL